MRVGFVLVRTAQAPVDRSELFRKAVEPRKFAKKRLRRDRESPAKRDRERFPVQAHGCSLDGVEWTISSGAKQAAEKVLILGEIWQKHTSGAEARVDLIGFIPGMNPRPTTRMLFSAACKAR